MYEQSTISKSRRRTRPKTIWNCSRDGTVQSFHVQKALEAYLSEIADLQVAYDRLHDTADPVISVDDMRKELEL